jgi:hypothetical protein
MGRSTTLKMSVVRLDGGCRSLMNKKLFTGDQQMFTGE